MYTFLTYCFFFLLKLYNKIYMNDILGLKFVYVDTSVRGGGRKTFCFLWRVQQGPAAGAGNFCSYFTGSVISIQRT